MNGRVTFTIVDDTARSEWELLLGKKIEGNSISMPVSQYEGLRDKIMTLQEKAMQRKIDQLRD